MAKALLDSYVVRVDYPAIGESRFLTHAGQLSSEYPNARIFKSKREAQKAADTLRPNAVIESVRS